MTQGNGGGEGGALRFSQSTGYASRCDFRSGSATWGGGERTLFELAPDGGMVRTFEPPVYCYHEIVHNAAVVGVSAPTTGRIDRRKSIWRPSYRIWNLPS